MRKFIWLFIVIASLFASSASANDSQFPNAGVTTIGQASPGKYFVFARLIKNGNARNLYFDYGQKNSEGKRDDRGQVLVGEDGKAILLDYSMAVINQLIRLNWIPYGAINGEETYFYKEVSSEAEITEGLKFKK